MNGKLHYIQVSSFSSFLRIHINIIETRGLIWKTKKDRQEENFDGM